MRIYLLILPLFILSCNFSGKKTDDSIEVKLGVRAEVVSEDVLETSENGEYSQAFEEGYESEVDYFVEEAILFSKYKVEVLVDFIKAPLTLEDNEAAKYFRTRITEAYKSDEIDFGGYYISVLFGCGTGCIAGFIMDVRDGEVYALPLGEENMCFFDLEKAVFKPDSRLFISAVCGELESDKISYIAYLWNEENKEFNKIEEENFL